MTYYIKLGVILFMIAAIASGVLAFVNNFTKPIIEENQRQMEIEARRTVLPQAKTFEYVEDNLPYYRGYDEEGQLVGYTFMAVGAGYSGDIQTMVGLTADYKIFSISVLIQTETPGLGANCTRPEFTNQFSGKEVDELYIDVDSGDIDNITGATITARALTNSVKKASDIIIEQTKDLSDNTKHDYSKDKETV